MGNCLGPMDYPFDEAEATRWVDPQARRATGPYPLSKIYVSPFDKRDQYSRWNSSPRTKGVGSTYHAGFEEPDDQGLMPLLFAVIIGDTTEVELLCKQGVDMDGIDGDGSTALHIAVRECNSDIVECLCKYGANLEASDHDGLTPLMHAAMIGNEDIVECLCGYGADTTSCDHKGLTAFLHAEFNGHVHVSEYIYRYGIKGKVSDDDISIPEFLCNTSDDEYSDHAAEKYHHDESHSSGVSKKRALLIGCSYIGSTNELQGPASDIKLVRKMLVENFGFRDSDIKVLEDDAYNYFEKPGRSSIMNGIDWLVRDGCSDLFFYFSGHGGRYDDGEQYICTTDVTLDEKSAHISSTELNQRLVQRVGKNVTMYALVDCCHSGNIFLMPYTAHLDGGTFKKWHASCAEEELHTRAGGGCTYLFSASSQEEVAHEVFARQLSLTRPSNFEMIGAATYAFCNAILKHSQAWNGKVTLGELLEYMKNELLCSGKFSSQTPLLATNTLADCFKIYFGL